MNPTASRFRTALLYGCAWLPFFVLQLIVLRMFEDSMALAVRDEISYTLPAVILGGICWWIDSRLPWARYSWKKLIAIEVALGLAFDLTWHTVFVSELLLFAGPDVTRSVAQSTLGWQVVSGLTIYALQAAAFHTLRITRELRRQQVAAAEADAARTRAEMLALRGQLDPHFLFNSLHSIIALVREDPRRGEEALLQFSELLRQVLATKRDSTDEVTLAAEMRFVEDYLAIERLRLGERLRVQCEVTDEARICRVPAFTVQPLVENSIRHAIAPHRAGAALAIRGQVTAGVLEIEVRDDGPGADPAALAGAGGVGLRVIKQRLQLVHGDQADLSIQTAPGRGFSATLRLPAERDGAAERSA